MVIYLVLIALLIALTFMPKDNKRLSEYLFWGMVAVLVILAGYRYGIGTDYSTYYHYYDNIRMGGKPWALNGGLSG